MIKASFRNIEKSQSKSLQGSEAILLVSPGQPYYQDQEKLLSIIELINRSQFQSVNIVIGDTNHRYNLAVQGMSDLEAFQYAKLLGDQWLEHSQDAINRLSVPYQITRWTDWVSHSQYPHYKQLVNENYDTNPLVKTGFEQSISEYLLRQNPQQINADNYEQWHQASLEYLKEECAIIMPLWAELQVPYIIYPNRMLQAMLVIYKALVKPQYGKQYVQWLPVRFKRLQVDSRQETTDTVSIPVQEYEKLKQSYHAYHSLLNALPINAYWKDHSGKLLHCNLQQAKALGFEKTESVIGVSPGELFASDRVTQLKKNDQKVIDNDRLFIFEESSITEDKEEIYLSYKAPYYSEQGKSLGLMGLSFNVTEDRLKLQRNELILSEVLLALPGHVYWKNLEGRLLGCNRAQANFLGFDTVEELIGKTDYDITSQEEADKIRHLDERAIKERMPQLSIEVFEHQTGEKLFFMSSKHALIYDDKVIGVLGVSLNITDQKRADKLEQEAALIEKTMNSMKSMAASIAHEMRTPLASIGICAATIRRLSPKVLSVLAQAQDQGIDLGMRRRDLQAIASMPGLLDGIIARANNFIDMQLQNVNEGDLGELTVLSIAQVTQAAMDNYPQDKADDIVINMMLKPDFYFRGDETSYTHVVFNLLKNALFYIREAGKGEVSIWTELGDDYNILHFKDTGSGISIEILPHIFDQFFSKTRHGTGVGLAYCKATMEKMGGKIVCQSLHHQYTHFRLYFPVYEEA